MNPTEIQEGEVVSPYPTLTPLPKVQGKAMTMDFADAMREVIKGKKITRLSWANGDYCLLKDEWLTIFTKGDFHTWTISSGDMIDTQDWVIVEEALS